MEISLRIKDTLYMGWENVRITKSMQSIAHTFSMSIFNGDGVDITQNDLITILKDGEPFLTGYADVINLSISDKKKPLRISGRSKAMDLIDCDIETNKQYSGLTALQIIDDLIKPFAITASSGLSMEAIGEFNTRVGETYFNAINRICKQTNILPISDNLGNIVLIKNEDKRSSTVLKDADFKDLNFTQKFNRRYSQYTYKKETAIVDVLDAKLTDNVFNRFRPFVGVNTDDKTNEDLANWQKNNDESRSISLNGKVIGWDLDINTIAKLETEVVNNTFLIKDIAYSKTESGTVSDVVFVGKNLFKVK